MTSEDMDMLSRHSAMNIARLLVNGSLDPFPKDKSVAQARLWNHFCAGYITERDFSDVGLDIEELRVILGVGDAGFSSGVSSQSDGLLLLQRKLSRHGSLPSFVREPGLSETERHLISNRFRSGW